MDLKFFYKTTSAVYYTGQWVIFMVVMVPVFNLLPQALTASAHSVLHQGIPLQAGTAQFGCSDIFQQTLIICPPTLQGMFNCNCQLLKYEQCCLLQQYLSFPLYPLKLYSKRINSVKKKRVKNQIHYTFSLSLSLSFSPLLHLHTYMHVHVSEQNRDT